MLLLLLRRRRLSHLLLLLPSSPSCSSSSSSTASSEAALIFSSSPHLSTTPLRFSTAATQNPPPEPSFIIKYLIDSCGFSPERASKASKPITHLKSPSKPDSVLRFLKQIGLTDAHIRKFISSRPNLLCANVDKTLKPKLEELQQMGFSESELIHLISENPGALRVRVSDLQPKIMFWKSLLGTNKELLKAMTKNHFLLTCNLGKRAMRNVSLLRQCGISDAQIAKMLLNTPRFITSSPSSVEAAITRAEDMGVSRCSGMFWQMLKSVICTSQTRLDAKLKLLKSLGWSEAEVFSAIRKMPALLNISEKKTCNAVEFLTKEVGCDLSYIATHPVLLALSLERRLIPRHCVLRALNREGLLKRGRDPSSMFSLTEDQFFKRFILPYKDMVPGLHGTYAAAHSNVTQVRMRSEGESMESYFTERPFGKPNRILRGSQ